MVHAEKRQIIKESSAFTGSTLAAMMIRNVRAIFIAGVLGATGYGIWNALLLVVDYGQHAHLGVLDAVNWRIPYKRGQGDELAVQELRNNSFGWILALGITITFAVFAASFFIPARYSSIWRWGIRVVSLVFLLQYLYNYLFLLYKTEKRFVALGKASITLVIVNTVVVVSLALRYDIWAVFLGAIVAPAVALVYLVRKSGGLPRPRLDLKATKQYIILGFPLMLTGVIGLMLKSLDRIMVIWFFNATHLGYYAFAVMLSLPITMIAGLISQPFIPRYFEAYGRSSDMWKHRGLLKKATLSVVYLAPLLIGFVVIGAPFVVGLWFLSDFAPSLPLVTILALGAYFHAISFMFWNVLVSQKLQNRLLLLSIASLAINFTLNVTLVSLGFGLVGIAIATAISFAFHGMSTLLYGLSRCGWPARERLAFTLQVLAPLGYTVLMLWLISFIPAFISGSIPEELAMAAVRFCIFAAGMLPLIVWVNRKTGVITETLGMVKDLLGKGKRA